MFCLKDQAAAHRTAPQRFTLLSVAVAGILAAQGGSAAEIVANGSFEEPVVPVEELDKNWTTYYGQNATPTTCEENLEEECNGGMLIPGWSVDWFDFELDDDGNIVPIDGGPGRIELQRDVEGEPAPGGISAYDGDQKAELDSHHRYQPPDEPTVSNNIAIYQTLPTCGLSAYELSFAWKARTEDAGDSTLLVVVDDTPLLTVGDFKPGWQEESYKFISSPEPGQLLGFTSIGLATTLGAFVDGVSVQGPDGTDPLSCERTAVCGDKPAMIELLYDADLNGEDFYDQDEDSVVIETFGDLPNVAKIKVFDHKKRRTELYSGTVVIGQSFEVTGEATGKKWIPPKLIIEITDPATGEMVQSVEFHTSCSQPLNVGDQYGGIAVFDFSR